MKTLTEFDGFSLRNALAKKQELTTLGKTAEELVPALGEALKVEGDRLNYLAAALEVVGTKTESLKRVVVYTAEEGKPAPKGTTEKDGKYYLVEYFFVPSAKKERRPGHDKGKGPRGKKRGRDGKRGRGPRRDPSQMQATDGGPANAGAPATGGDEQGENRRRRRRPPRGAPRAPKSSTPPNVKPNVVPNAQPSAAPAQAAQDTTTESQTQSS